MPQFWFSAAFGILPDFLAFGLPFASAIAAAIGIGSQTGFGPGATHTTPNYVHTIYNVTHSLIVWAVVFGALWFIYKKPIKASYARLLHILIDIPTHSLAFFATPFLWPISSYKFDGIPRSNKMIFIPNIIVLIIIYSIYLRRKYQKNKKTKNKIDK